jgi:hypothetical protein
MRWLGERARLLRSANHRARATLTLVFIGSVCFVWCDLATWRAPGVWGVGVGNDGLARAASDEHKIALEDAVPRLMVVLFMAI